MSQPLVSVIIPTYNASDTIEMTLDSIFAQTYKNHEIIVVDDGSTDRTSEILWPLANSGKIHLIIQENFGPSAARNAGIMSARGEYIAFLDSDDIFATESIERRVKVLTDHSDVSLVFTDFCFGDDIKLMDIQTPFYRSKYMLKKFSKSIEKVDGLVYFFKKDFFRNSILNNIEPSIITVIVRRVCLDKIGLFDESLRNAEDSDMWFRIQKEYKVAFIDQPLSFYRKLRGGLSSNVEGYCLGGIKFFVKQLSDNDVRNDVKLVSHIKKKIGYRYGELGDYYFGKGLYTDARRVLLLAIINCPWQGKTFLLLLLSLLPAIFIQSIKSIKSFLLQNKSR